ncbi:zinc-dependent dehydrogenase [Ensifer sp. YR511]|uniref:zinc-dependent dehydrogenase n=1 Tax=Ensifer sp. YR511 TaxID=1855294 RepID=UPI00088AEFE1|nr:zinc-dependent dehydrogenase [Ensifer sp. YR511]SDN04469.1 Threonine dehydrogenase [Ensifer sp. YR511]
MRAAVFKGKGHISLDERDRPKPKADEVLVRVFAASICGTDLKVIRGGHFRVGENDTRVLGHELAGEIVEVGRHVTQWKIGTRVSAVPNIGCGHCDMCRRGLNNMCPDYSAFGIDIDGGFQQYMIVTPQALYGGNLFKIPETMSFEEASLVEPLSCCFNGWKDLQVTPEDRVLVMGTGPIAGMFLQLAKAYGTRQVIVVGRRAERLAEIAPLGATDTVDSSQVNVVEEVMRLTDGHGVDVALTCAPAPELQVQAIECLARLGRMNFFSGLSKGSKVEIDTNKVHYWGLKLLGSTGSSVEDYAKALKLVETGQIRVTDVVTHRFGMADAVAAFEHALSGRGMKTIIYPQEETLQ